MKWWSQFSLICWKNLIIRKRHWFSSILESALPVLLFLLVAYARSKIGGFSTNEVRDATYNLPSYSSNESEWYNKLDVASTNVLYAPTTDFTEALMRKFQIKLNLYKEGIKNFNSKQDLLEYFTKHINNTAIVIIFELGDVKQLNYEIGIYKKYADLETKQLFIQSWLPYYPGQGSSQYVNGEELSIQVALDLSYMEMLKKSQSKFTYMTKEFPYPPHKEDPGLVQMFMPFLSHITIFSFIFLCPGLIMRVVEEKSCGSRELQKMMGLKSWMLYFSWFINSFMVNFVSVMLIVILMKVPIWGSVPIEYCNWSVYLVFLTLYLSSCITFCFAITTLFNRPIFAMLFGVLAWILSYTIPEPLIGNSVTASKSVKLLFALFPNMCLSYGYKIISIFEAREIGVNWSNIGEYGTGGLDDITMLEVFLMFMMSIIVYVTFTMYVSAVFPGPCGISRSWTFPFKYTCKMLSFNKVDANRGQIIPLKENDEYEAQDSGIILSNIHKTFGNTVAVNNLSMKIMKNNITVLLGHNGAGKTTTMSMITGMLDCPKGSIKICNKDIGSEEDEIRKLMGLCPQHNLLFQDLTVLEHLRFIGGLKGLSKEEVLKEGKSLLKKLNMEGKENDMAFNLSGGMKRKLCLAMAVIGPSRVLILDEPTAGMDPESQRVVWNLLLEWRRSKTILLSTHYMDEADTLADYIAIMSHGSQLCYDTPMSLKEEYKTGYHLSLKLNTEEMKDEITKLVKSVIPESSINEDYEESIVYILPIKDKGQFHQLLKRLEENKVSLKIENISLNITTLEDVFLSSNKTKNSSSVDIKPITGECTMPKCKLSSGSRVFVPLLLKRIYFLRMKWPLFIISLLLTLVIINLTIYLGQPAETTNNGAGFNFKFNLNKYGPTGVFVSSNVDVDVDDADIENVKNLYSKLVKQQMGEVFDVESTSGGIIAKGMDNLQYYKTHMIVAAEFNATTDGMSLTAMYSPYAVHGAPIAFNLISNAAVKAELGPDYSISTSLIGLQKNHGTVEKEDEVAVGILWLILFPLSLLILLGSYVIYPHMELSTSFIQLQLMCGVPAWKYWLYNFAFDYVLFIISTFLLFIFTLLFTAIFGWSDFSGALVPLLLLMWAYGWAVLPFTYIFGRFNTAAGGYAVLIVVSLLVGVLMTVVVMVLKESGDSYYMNVGLALYWTFTSLFPQFGLTFASVNYARNVVRNYNWYVMVPEKRSSFCRFRENPCCQGATSECAIYQSYFLSEDLGILSEIWRMIIPWILYYLLNVLLNYNIPEICRNKFYQVVYGGSIFNPPAKEMSLPLIQWGAANLKKRYGSKLVVGGVDFQADKGTCFGLLGVNGAGKTTTFKMLTKEISKSAGTCRIFDNDYNPVMDEKPDYLTYIGYCPQENALNFALTGRQTLLIMAFLRGYNYTDAKETANCFIDLMDLHGHADKPCGFYSGGNKRKLCLALALIGDPKNVFLDEPTNGVDPVSRRHFWEIIRQMQKKGLTFLLTSHSMQECEALCKTLGIMKDGKIEAIGSIPKLKEQFHVGYTVKVKLRQSAPSSCTEKDKQDVVLGDFDVVDGPSSDNVVKFRSTPVVVEVDGGGSSRTLEHDPQTQAELLSKIKSHFQNEYNGKLKDEHLGLLHYHVTKQGVMMSGLFKYLEEMKNQSEGLIEDYVITETTIEDVFLTVAKQKDEGEHTQLTNV